MKMIKRKYIFLVLMVFCNCLKALSEPVNIIACVNHKPIYTSEFNRLLKAKLKKFEKQYLFDPWQASSLDELEERYKLIEKAKSKNILVKPQDILAYKNNFQQKVQRMGNPINTYDLNSYAEENALLFQFFQQEALKTIQDNLIEKSLIVEEAKKTNLQIQNAEIENRLAEIKNKYKTEENFKSFLRNNNITELELKASLEEQIAIEKLKNKFENNQNFEEWFKAIKENSLIEFAISEENKTSLSCLPKPAQAKPPEAPATNSNSNNLRNWFKWKRK